MKSAATAHYEKLLVEEKKLLERELSSIGRQNPLNPLEWEALSKEVSPEPDENDAAVIIEEYEENRAVLTELNARYRLVLSALERIEQKTYGICTISEDGRAHQIEKERLDADSAAQTCKAHLNVAFTNS